MFLGFFLRFGIFYDVIEDRSISSSAGTYLGLRDFLFLLHLHILPLLGLGDLGLTICGFLVMSLLNSLCYGVDWSLTRFVRIARNHRWLGLRSILSGNSFHLLSLNGDLVKVELGSLRLWNGRCCHWMTAHALGNDYRLGWLFIAELDGRWLRRGFHIHEVFVFNDHALLADRDSLLLLHGHVNSHLLVL